MTFTVYNTGTKRQHKVYATERAAKGVVTRLNNKGKAFYGFLDTKTFNEMFNQKVAVTNLLSGKEVMINQRSEEHTSELQSH
mgnify:CR=1 FL=1